MSLVTSPRQFLVDANGTPRVGAKANFYASGTSTPITVYTTPAYSVAHSNPVLSVAGGLFPAVYVDPSANSTYKMVITDSADVSLYSEDNIPASAVTQAEIGAALYPISTAEEALGLTTATLDRTHYYGDPFRYLAEGDGSTVDDTAFTNALAANSLVEVQP